MKLRSDLLGFGSFDPSLATALDYPEHFYENVAPGTLIVTTLFLCATQEQSRLLADAVGLRRSRLWDFSRHQIDPHKVDLDRLAEVFPFDPSCQDFCRLRDAGFVFFFRPNGWGLWQDQQQQAKRESGRRSARAR